MSDDRFPFVPTMLLTQFDDRGVSDAMGYVIVFGVVIVSVSVIFATGAGTVEDLRHNAETTNAERAMKVFGSNIADIYERGAPSRSTEIKLSGQDITLGEQEAINITVEDASGSTVGQYRIVGRPVVFTAPEATFSYTFGMIGRISNDGVLVREQPPFHFDSQQTILTVVQQSGSYESLSGSSNAIMIRAVSSDTSVLQMNSSSTYLVTIEVDTTKDRARLWQRYFENKGLDPVDGTYVDGDIAYSYTTNDIVIRRHKISFDLVQ